MNTDSTTWKSFFEMWRLVGLILAVDSGDTEYGTYDWYVGWRDKVPEALTLVSSAFAIQCFRYLPLVAGTPL